MIGADSGKAYSTRLKPGRRMFKPKPKIGEPPNQTKTPQKPSQPYLEGKTRQLKLMSNPPILVTQRYTNGKWVEISRKRMQPSTGGKKPAPAKPKKGMDLGNAIKKMQRPQPWN